MGLAQDPSLPQEGGGQMVTVGDADATHASLSVWIEWLINEYTESRNNAQEFFKTL